MARTIERGAAGRVAVLVPRHNEEISIAGVVRGFRAELPDAEIYVYDNNSRDRTATAAQAAGAIVRSERLQGKGNVVRRMYANVEADTYILVDGDGTYDPASIGGMLRTYLDGRFDMVCGARVTRSDDTVTRGRQEM